MELNKKKTMRFHLIMKLLTHNLKLQVLFKDVIIVIILFHPFLTTNESLFGGLGKCHCMCDKENSKNEGFCFKSDKVPTVM